MRIRSPRPYHLPGSITFNIRCAIDVPGGPESLVIDQARYTLALRQAEFFRVLRGETPGVNPFVPATPATCNADVVTLADYWTDQIARIGNNASDTYHRLVYSCWREVLHRVSAAPFIGQPAIERR